MKIADFLKLEAVVANLESGDAIAVLKELSQPLARAQQLDAKQLSDALIDRFKLGSTGVGDGLAIPHGRLTALTKPLASFGRSSKGIDFDARDGKPVHIFFTLFSPANSA